MPKNEASWEAEIGSGILWMASTLDCRGEIPLAERRKPTKSMAEAEATFPHIQCEFVLRKGLGHPLDALVV